MKGGRCGEKDTQGAEKDFSEADKGTTGKTLKLKGF